MGESTVKSTVSFDRFSVDPVRRVLKSDGEIIDLNPKTFDLLLALIENQGEIASKELLLDAVWGDQFVEENNLTVNISLLRKALGEKEESKRFIVTVPGRGYKFIAEIEQNSDKPPENESFKKLGLDDELDESTDPSQGAPQKPVRLAILYPVLTFIAILLIGAGGVWIYRSVGTDSASKNSVNATSQRYVTDGTPQSLSISPDGKFLAFAEYRKGLSSLWIGDVETGNNIRITEPSTRIYWRVNFGPLGKYVYFVVQEEDASWKLKRVSVFGGAVEDVANDVYSAVTFAPDDKRIAFIRREDRLNEALIIFDKESEDLKEKVLRRFKDPESPSLSGLSWSPDGKSIAAFVSGKDGQNFRLVRFDVDTGEEHEIGNRIWGQSSNVGWLSDSTGLIVLNPDRTGHVGNSQIWLVSYPGGDDRQITNDLVNYSQLNLGVSRDDRIAVLSRRVDPQIWVTQTVDAVSDDKKIVTGARTRAPGSYGLAIAPDGKILFTANAGDSQIIWEMDADGSNQRQLTPTSANSFDSQISVTPDNRFIIFQSNRTGEREVWRANRDGSALRQLTSGGGNSYPAVSADGKWIIYSSFRDGVRTLWRIAIEGGTPKRLTMEESDFPAVSPDGRTIAASYGDPFFNELPRLAIFDIAGGKPKKVFTLPRDSILYNRMRWSPDGKSIVFKDYRQGLWRMDLNADKPEKLDLLEDFRVHHLAWSIDGRQFVYAGGVEVHEIIILENFR
ncbi:MAG: hypothetical protein HKN25_15685 [Pyrinomonadaceae bacterium]|nr:hypothetical protein [Pyrinomonadaceae bacterium]